MELETTVQNQTSQRSYQLPFIIGKTSNDMKFVGLFHIIYGALCCLTIIGALIGIPLIIAGLKLREAGDSFLYFRDSNDASLLERGFEQQGKFFSIQKILIIVGLIFMVIYFIFIFMLIGSGIFDAISNQEVYY